MWHTQSMEVVLLTEQEAKEILEALTDEEKIILLCWLLTRQ